VIPAHHSSALFICAQGIYLRASCPRVNASARIASHLISGIISFLPRFFIHPDMKALDAVCGALCLSTLLACLLTPTAARGQLTPSAAEKFQQGTISLQQGKLDVAAEAFESVIQESPRFAGAYFNLGLVREQQGEFGAAVSSLQKALALDPKLRGANLFLGIAEYRLNHYDLAMSALRAETKANSSDPKAWMWLGVAELAAEKPEAAVVALDKAAQLAPDDVDILYHRGHAHMLVSKASYEHMLRVSPDSWRVHQVLAQADSEADRDMDAIAEYKAAIKDAPGQPGLHEELATEYWKSGKLDEAEAEYTQELAIDPHSLLATYKLGSLRVDRGKPQEGKPLIEAALKENQSLPNAYYYLGRAEMQLGNNPAAVDDFKRAVAASNTDPDIAEQAYYQLSQIYRRLHQTEEAQAALANFLRLKQEATEHQQQIFERKRKAHEQAEPAPSEAAPTESPDREHN
jgi:tetratricopeptide (TPR) repeat protein